MMEVAPMSLSSHEQHALHSIEDQLCVSDPELASLLATFTRLTADEDMPVREKTPAGPRAGAPGIGAHAVGGASAGWSPGWPGSSRAAACPRPRSAG